MSRLVKWTRAAALLTLVAGCTGGSPVSHSPVRYSAAAAAAVPAPPPALTAFDSCTQLLTEFRAAAAKNTNGVIGGLTPTARAADAAAPTFSGTNVQEQGVDEPDTVKTDGRRIVTLTGGVLHVIDPASRQVTGRLDLGQIDGATQLLLAGDHALVLGSASVGIGPTPLIRGGPARGPLLPGLGRVELILVDLTGTPRVISRYQGDGRLVDARQTGSVARIVLRSTPRITFPIRTDAAQGNKAPIDAAPIDSWLPSWQVTTGSTTTHGRLGCGSVVRPAAISGTTLLTVLSVDLSAPALGDGNPIGIVAGGDTVYATPTSLYVADNQFTGVVGPGPASPISTAIYRFALSVGPRAPTYSASGRVPGTLLNAYALSEWDGYLRVATTAGNTSAVRILQERNGRLVQVGTIGGLGAGEQIYAVRFLAGRGYVVTFRQTDPLYSLDLTDPAHPRATGSLKMTGYSAYLQAVDDGRLIGIGQEATAQGQLLGTQISLFDVVESAAPRRLAQLAVPGGASQAEFDPHAVLWWPATQLLVVPISTPASGDAAPEAALAARVTDSGLQTVARIRVPAGPVTRQLVVGDTLWIVTAAGLLTTPLSTLSTSATSTWLPLH